MSRSRGQNRTMKDRRRIIDDQLHAHFVTFSVFWPRRLLDHDHPKRIPLGVFNEELQQPTYYSFEIYRRSKLEEKLRYMHDNPVRSGLVEQATDWKWSPARWYEWRRSVGVPIQWVE